MKTIWKYILDIVDDQEFNIPKESKIVHIGEQNGKLCMWVEHEDPSVFDKENIRSFGVFGTGERIINPYHQYVGTSVGDSFVWHLYEWV